MANPSSISELNLEDQVIYGSLTTLAREVGHRLKRAAYSSLIRESDDYGAAIVSDGFELLAEAETTPLQMGPLAGYCQGLMRALEEAGETLLHADGLRIVMLTGDSRRTADAVAKQLGIDEVFAEVLPDEKRTIIQRLQSEGRVVAMAGDGINDAPALAESTVGIAMGTGTDVAIESAGVTLVKGDLRGIAKAIRLSHATMRNVKQNLFFAFVYNALGVPVAAGVLYPVFGLLLSPIFAGAAMAMSSVSVVTNALRLRRARL